MKNLPERIYLNIGDEVPADVDFRELSEVTWSEEKMSDNDIAFTRKLQWISVEEELPEFDKRVLICERVADKRKVFIGRRIQFSNGDWGWSQSTKESVTHWRELPSLPDTNTEKR